MDDLQIRVDKNFAALGYSVYIFEQTNGRISICEDIIMRTLEEGQLANPKITLRESQAQQLMDDLWNAGIRPTSAKIHEGTVEAINRHLEDMRKISGHKLGITF